MIWLVFAAFSGILQSFSFAYNKHGANLANEYVSAWAMRLFSLLLLIPVSVLTNSFSPISLKLLYVLVFIGVFNGLTSILIVKAVKNSPVSQVLPLLGLSPAFLLITTPLINKETIPLLGVAGVFLVVVGSYLISIGEKNKNFFYPLASIFRSKGSFYAIMVAAIFAFSGSVLKLGLNYTNPIYLSTLTTLAIFISTSLVMLVTKSKVNYVFRHPKIFIPSGVAIGLSLVFQNLSLNNSLTAYSLSVKRVGIIFNVLWGKVLFKEKHIKTRLLAASIILLGVLIISFS